MKRLEDLGNALIAPSDLVKTISFPMLQLVGREGGQNRAATSLVCLFNKLCNIRSVGYAKPLT